jgi:pimeloyl-ACP methyl ester carboxylesterase
MPQATAGYVPMMGAYLANTLATLNQKGIDYGNMVLIGHSFGAHVAGVVGLKTGGKIGAIYGLDPAGPFFYDKNNILTNTDENRLDKTDAQFVQVLHTNAKFYGTSQAIGHQDFYPNGGDGMPNCTKSFLVGKYATFFFQEIWKESNQLFYI